jgi:hypothetical protein
VSYLAAAVIAEIITCQASCRLMGGHGSNVFSEKTTLGLTKKCFQNIHVPLDIDIYAIYT